MGLATEQINRLRHQSIPWLEPIGTDALANVVFDWSLHPDHHVYFETVAPILGELASLLLCRRADSAIEFWERKEGQEMKLRWVKDNGDLGEVGVYRDKWNKEVHLYPGGVSGYQAAYLDKNPDALARQLATNLYHGSFSLFLRSEG